MSFLSCDVDVAVDELQGEWDRVQKTLAIARHVSDMARQKGFEDVRLLSFNLLTIEFTYLTVSYRAYVRLVNCDTNLTIA